MHNISLNNRAPRNHPTSHPYDMRPFRLSSEQKHHHHSHSVCIDEADSPSTSYRVAVETKHKRSLSRPIIPRLNLDYDYLE